MLQTKNQRFLCFQITLQVVFSINVIDTGLLVFLNTGMSNLQLKIFQINTDVNMMTVGTSDLRCKYRNSLHGKVFSNMCNSYFFSAVPTSGTDGNHCMTKCLYLLQRFLCPCFFTLHVDNRCHRNHHDNHDTCTTKCYVEGSTRCH